MTYIQRLDGELLDLDKAGLRTKDFVVSSPSYAHETEKIEGFNGVIDLETTIDPREITVAFRFIANDWMDFGLMRDEVFKLFRSKESFYLIEKRNKGKRWLVKVNDSFQIPQRGMFGDFEMSFMGLKGVSESIGTTKDIHENGIDANDELWGFGMGLIDEMAEHEELPATWFYVGGKKWSDFLNG